MLRFLGQLLLFLSVLMGVKGLAWWLSLPQWQKNVSSFDYKSAQFERLHPTYNAVFVGSSRTGMSIIPSRFDSLTGQALHSYNYGVASFFTPHTFRLTESLLRRPDLSLRYIFVELSLPSPILLEEPLLVNPLAEVSYRARLWRLYKELTQGSSWDSWINNYALAVLSPKICLRAMPSVIQERLGRPLPINHATDTTHVQYDFIAASDGYLRDRRLSAAIWRPDMALLPTAHQLAKRAFGAPASAVPDASYWSDIDKLLQLAKERRIELMFYLPNRLLPAEAQLLPPIFRRLPARNRLTINANRRFDSLFSPSNSFNKGHLNYRGAQQYTRLLAEEFTRKNPPALVSQTRIMSH